MLCVGINKMYVQCVTPTARGLSIKFEDVVTQRGIMGVAVLTIIVEESLPDMTEESMH